MYRSVDIILHIISKLRKKKQTYTKKVIKIIRKLSKNKTKRRKIKTTKEERKFLSKLPSKVIKHMSDAGFYMLLCVDFNTRVIKIKMKRLYNADMVVNIKVY